MTPAPPPASASGRPRPRAVGSLLAILAVVTVSLILRPAATSTGPLIDDILAHYGQGPAAAGVLTALPPLSMGLLGMIAVPLARRGGLTGTLVASLVLATIGLLLRPSAPTFLLFLLVSGLALLGPALGNVLVPAWVKRHGGPLTVVLMTLYTGLVSFGGAIASAVAVPLSGSASDGWADSLRFWGLVSVIPVLVWVIALTRTGHDFPAQGPTGELRGSLLRSPTALAMTLMFGLQSMNYYVQAGLLPTVLTDAGVPPVTAGLAVGLIATWALLGGLLMPTVVERVRRLPLLGLVLGLCTASGYLGLLLAPASAPFLWASVLGIGGFCFPAVIALIPARTRDVVVTARLSGMVQPLGYLISAAGSVLAGLVLQATGSGPALLGMMLVVSLGLAAAALRACAPCVVDEEIAGR